MTGSIGLLRQLCRAIALITQPAQQSGAILGLLQTGEAHLCALGIILRAEDELVDRGEVPGLAETFDGIGIGKALVAASLAADDTPEIGADLVRAAFAEIVAGLALAGNRFALGWIGGGDHGHGWREFRATGTAGRGRVACRLGCFGSRLGGGFLIFLVLLIGRLDIGIAR